MRAVILGLSLLTRPLVAQLEIRFLDLGQSDAALVREGGKTVRIDAGPSAQIAGHLRLLSVENQVDSWQERSGRRQVFKFRLRLIDEPHYEARVLPELDHLRMISSDVKREVWKRDKGKCVTCGATDNSHFDHVIPYSKGGSSLVAENVQLLCARVTTSPNTIELNDLVTTTPPRLRGVNTSPACAG